VNALCSFLASLYLSSLDPGNFGSCFTLKIQMIQRTHPVWEYSSVFSEFLGFISISTKTQNGDKIETILMFLPPF
jgi:hypothetical protein